MSESERREMADYAHESAFSSRQMALDYLELYDEVIRNKYLNPPELAAKMVYNPPDPVIVKK